MKHWIAEYFAIVFGLLVGTMAHFGRLLSSGEMFTARQAAGFILQLAFIGVLASVATNKLGITDDDMRALTTAILAISAQEVIQYMRRNGWGPFAAAIVPEADKRQAEQRERSWFHMTNNADLEKLAKKLDEDD